MINMPVEDAVLDKIPAARQEAVVLFVSGTCESCRSLMKELDALGRREYPIYVAIDTSSDESLRAAVPQFVEPVPDDRAADVWSRLAAGFPTPFGVYLRDGKIKGWLRAASWSEFDEKIVQPVRGTAPTEGGLTVNNLSISTIRQD
jgi:hypothetical protein